MNPKLRRALELKAKKEKRGKNWIISQALENYLDNDTKTDLAEEAQRQSRIAAQQTTDDWSTAADHDQWK